MNAISLISVIIPSYNSSRTIAACLDSVLAQETETPYEVLVMDSSRDETPELVRQRYPRVRYFHSDVQMLPGVARNAGVAQARGEVLAFIDSDCVADRSWLRCLVAALGQGYRIVGGAVANLNPQSWISVADYLLTFNEFTPGTPRREVQYLPSVNLACTRELFDELGGFPDIPTGEDMLLTFAASRRTPMLFDPGAVVRHRNRESLRGFVHHHYAYGSNASRIRKTTPLSGSTLARFPVLAPAAPLARAARIGARILFRNRALLPGLIVSAPWVALGIGCWGCGFVRGALAHDPAG